MKQKKTRAEIQRAYRERLKAEDPDKAREKERQRWHKRRTQKKVKGVEDMTERSKRTIRRKWREQKAAYRKMKKMLKVVTPPSSSYESDVEKPKRGRPKQDYRRTKAYRKISQLSGRLIAANSAKEKYKQRWLRLKLKIPEGREPSKKKTIGSRMSIASDTSSAQVLSVGDLQIQEVHSPGSSVQSIDSCCVHGNALDGNTKQLIADFFERDDNSRLTTGKKQTVTRFKTKKQKRLLSDSMLNLHEKFCAEYPSNVVSYVTFTRQRPFWVCQANAQDRDTCLCKKHENIQLAGEKLFQLGLLKHKRSEDLLSLICCSIDRRECMCRECEDCSEKFVVFEENGVVKDDSVVVWSEWTTVSVEYEKGGNVKTSKATKKVVRRGMLKELKAWFCDSIRNVLARHVFIIRHQFRAYKHLKETLDVNETVIHIDFSENYNCKHAAEIQSAHFGASNEQATLHTGVAYTIDGLQSFATVSNSLRHDPIAIWAHLLPVLEKLRSQNPEVTDLHFFSDGPTTQYRNKQNFFLFSTILHELGFESGSWNFFESGHGKGAPDAIGGALKRKADAIVNAGCDIPDAASLHDILSSQSDSAVEMYFVDQSKISHFESKCPKTLRAITGTMKLHQLITDDIQCLAFRNLSCFCMRPTMCTCYNLQRQKFSSLEGQHVSFHSSNPIVFIIDHLEQ